MNIPPPPLFTNVPSVDLELLKVYVADLYSSLIANTGTGYVVAGITEDKVLTFGDSLPQTQNFLGTLVQDLIAKGVITP